MFSLFTSSSAPNAEVDRYTTEEEAMKGKLKGNCISKITQVDLRKDLTDQQAQQNYHNQVDFYYI